MYDALGSGPQPIDPYLFFVVIHMILRLRHRQSASSIEREEEEDSAYLPIAITLSASDILPLSMSTAPLLDEQDESVQIAVKALGSMRNRSYGLRTLPPLSISAASPPSPSSPTYQTLSPLPHSPIITTSNPPTSSQPLPPTPAQQPPLSFVSRMSQFPIVDSAIRAYEHGKASSRVVKFGAEMVESISRPLADRLPMNQIDEFAGRQLDRLDRYRRPSNSASERPEQEVSSSDRGRPRLKTKTFDGSTQEEEGWPQERDASMHREMMDSRSANHVGPNVNRWIQATKPYISPPSPPPILDSRSTTPVQKVDRRDSSRDDMERSRWQTVLSEAGGISAALSDENMKKIKYCLEWLQYATARIDAQILILRDFTSSLQPLPSESPSSRRPPISEEQMRQLSDVRRDIVGTIRQVVDIVSKHAGTALPQPARDRVRGFILTLPERWANKAGPAVTNPAPAVPAVVDWCPPDRERAKDRERDRERDRGETIAAAGDGTGASARRAGAQRRAAAQRERGAGAAGPSTPSSRASSPIPSPRINRPSVEPMSTPSTTVSFHLAGTAAQRILTLATESLDMMRNVTSVMKDSLERAEAWVGRLRTVGIDRSGQEGTSAGLPTIDDDRPRSSASEYTRLPPLSLLTSSPSLQQHQRSNHERSTSRFNNDNTDTGNVDEDERATSPIYHSTSTDLASSSSSTKWDRSNSTSNLSSLSTQSIPITPGSHSPYPYSNSDPRGYSQQRPSSSTSIFSTSRLPSPPRSLQPPHPPTNRLPTPNYGGMSGRKMSVSQILGPGDGGVGGFVKREEDIDDHLERERERERFPRYDQSQPYDSRRWGNDQERKERDRQARLERDQRSRDAFLNDYQHLRKDSRDGGGRTSQIADEDDDGEESEEEGRRMDVEY